MMIAIKNCKVCLKAVWGSDLGICGAILLSPGVPLALPVFREFSTGQGTNAMVFKATPNESLHRRPDEIHWQSQWHPTGQ